MECWTAMKTCNCYAQYGQIIHNVTCKQSNVKEYILYEPISIRDAKESSYHEGGDSVYLQAGMKVQWLGGGMEGVRGGWHRSFSWPR